ncbi:MAG: hypothetical protein C0404_10050 [Verrucomicrobia bacterium]|nr:hypothetical protein [Verrucomicrobiota bacterium]
MTQSRSVWLSAAAAILLVIISSAAAQDAGGREAAGTYGVKGGFAVFLGTANTDRMAGLANSGRFLVHGLDTDAAAIERARTVLEKTGLYGRRVSVEQGRLAPLPYASNIANLLVVDGSVAGLDLKEVFRAVTPNGVVSTGPGAPGRTELEAVGFKDVVAAAGGFVGRKPRPAGMDEWTHWRHDAADNAVSKDDATGGPAQLQWIGNPRMYKAHKASILALSAGGRVFHTHDDVAFFSDAKELSAGQTPLVARDAYNGMILWKKGISVGGLRCLVAAGERVYAVKALKGPCVALDGATGDIVQTYAGSEGTFVIRYEDGVLLLQRSGELLAADAVGGGILWKHSFVARDGGEFLAAGGRVFLFSRGDGTLLGLDLKTGNELWKQTGPAWLKQANLSACSPDMVGLTVSGKNNTVYVLSAKNGTPLWNRDVLMGNHYFPAQGLSLVKDVLYVRGGLTSQDDETRGYLAFDALTGAEKGYLPFARGGGGGKCSIENLTLTRFLKGGLSGSLEAGKSAGATAYRDLTSMRSSCKIGTVPANNLLYFFAQDCGCGNTLRGTFAFAPDSAFTEPSRVPERLVKGPGAQGKLRLGADDWPTFLRDPARSGATQAGPSGSLPEITWSSDVGMNPTAPVAAGGLVFAGSGDHHVMAFDAASGQLRWKFTTGGPLRYPPTFAEGLCLAGSSDGWIYALNTETGALVWRLHAAPTERKIVAFEQVESAWPVAGGVLVKDNVAYILAGRLHECDGTYVLAVECATGRILWENRVTKATTAEMLTMDGKFLYVNGPLMKTGTRDVVRIDPADGKTVEVDIKSLPGVMALGPHAETHSRFSNWQRGKVRAERIVFTPDLVFGVRWNRGGRDAGITGSSLFMDGKWKTDLAGLLVDSLIVSGKSLAAAGTVGQDAEICMVYADDGKKAGSIRLSARPVPNGLAAAGGMVFVATEDGRIHGLAAKAKSK